MFYIIGGLIILAIVIWGGIFIWRSFTGPTYEPGVVRAAQNLRAPLTPPTQNEGDESWLVEADIQLHHFAVGEGRNVLIVHGGPGQPYVEAWPGLESLTDQYQFHYYDQRGAGRSTRPIEAFHSRNYSANAKQLEQTLGLSAQIADIERIRQILGEEKLIIIGHSFGAFQASLYAAEFPEHVESLILVTPAPMLLMPMPLPGLFDRVEERLPEEMLDDYQRWLEKYFDFRNIFSQTEDDLVALNEEFARYFMATEASSDISVSESVHPGGWMVHAMYMSMGQRHDYRPAMEVVKAPVLVVHAADDIVQVEEASRSYLEVFPQAQFEVIDGGGHMVFYDQPDKFGEVIGEF
jgi:proline iminopeptidase